MEISSPPQKLGNSAGAKGCAAVALVAVGLGFAAIGFYIGDTDDAPGAALLGLLVLLGCVIVAAKVVRRKQ